MRENNLKIDQMLYNNQKIILAKNFQDYRIFLSSMDSSELKVHDFLEILYVIKGSVIISTEYETKKLNTGDSYIVSSNLVHRIIPDNKDNIMLVFQCNNYNHEKEDKKIILNDYGKKIEEELINLMGNIYITSIDKEISKIEKENKVIVYLNKIRTIVSKLNRINISKNSQDDIDYIVADIVKKLPKMIDDQVDTGLDSISKEYNISYSYLSRMFKKITGENYTEYLLKVRMNKTVDQLINTNKKILDISKDSGFSSIKTFNNTFRKIFNMSPTEFRESYSDIEYIESISPLYLDIQTQMFIEYIYNTNLAKREKELDNKYIINLKEDKVLIKNGIKNILDIDYLFKSYPSTDEVISYLDELKPNYLVMELFYDGNDLFILRSDNKKEKVFEREFNLLVSSMNRNSIRPFIRLNYSEIDLSKPVDYYEDYYMLLDRKIKLLNYMIGYRSTSEYIFEMYIPNMKKYLSNKKDLESVIRHIDKFRTTLLTNNCNGEKNLGIYFGEISEYKDFEIMGSLFKNVGKIDFINFDIALEIIMGSSLKYIINLLDDIKKYINNIYKDLPIITGFNYKIESYDEITEDKLLYYNLFINKLHIYAQRKGYILIGSSIYHKDKLIFKNYFTDEFGINQSAYYAYKAVTSLNDDIVLIDTGIIVSRSKDDEIKIYLYEDYDIYLENLYKYGYERYINTDKTIDLSILGLEGLYKFSEYKIGNNKPCLSSFAGDKRILLSLEEDEKQLLENKYKPKLNISFLKAEQLKNISVRKKPAEVLLIKLKKI